MRCDGDLHFSRRLSRSLRCDLSVCYGTRQFETDSRTIIQFGLQQLDARDFESFYTDRGERVLVHPGIPATSEQHDLMARYEELERRRHPDRVVPGSIEEEAALERIEEARAEERDRERPQRAGRLVSARCESGTWVEYRARPGRGIVRVVS